MKRFCILCLILVSCQEKKEGTTDSSPKIPSIRRGPYHVVKYQRRSAVCVSPDSLCATAQLVYPVFHAPFPSALNDSIRADVSAYSGVADPEVPIPLDPASLAREFTGNFDAFVRSQKGQPIFGSVWSLDVRTEVLRRTPAYLGLQIESYTYEGGAHPNSFVRFANYDPRTGRRLRLSDWLQPGTEARLNALAEKIFRKQEGLRADDQLEGYFFENNRFRLNDNFTLTSDGLRFVYNPYEIKPYVAGRTTLDVPWSVLRPLLRPGSLLE
jgi:hypothetical protein